MPELGSCIARMHGRAVICSIDGFSSCCVSQSKQCMLAWQRWAVAFRRRDRNSHCRTIQWDPSVITNLTRQTFLNFVMNDTPMPLCVPHCVCNYTPQVINACHSGTFLVLPVMEAHVGPEAAAALAAHGAPAAANPPEELTRALEVDLSNKQELVCSYLILQPCQWAVAATSLSGGWHCRTLLFVACMSQRLYLRVLVTRGGLECCNLKYTWYP